MFHGASQHLIEEEELLFVLVRLSVELWHKYWSSSYQVAGPLSADRCGLNGKSFWLFSAIC